MLNFAVAIVFEFLPCAQYIAPNTQVFSPLFASVDEESEAAWSPAVALIPMDAVIVSIFKELRSWGPQI